MYASRATPRIRPVDQCTWSSEPCGRGPVIVGSTSYAAPLRASSGLLLRELQVALRSHALSGLVRIGWWSGPRSVRPTSELGVLRYAHEAGLGRDGRRAAAGPSPGSAARSAAYPAEAPALAGPAARYSHAGAEGASRSWPGPRRGSVSPQPASIPCCWPPFPGGTIKLRHQAGKGTALFSPRTCRGRKHHGQDSRGWNTYGL